MRGGRAPERGLFGGGWLIEDVVACARGDGHDLLDERLRYFKFLEGFLEVSRHGVEMGLV